MSAAGDIAGCVRECQRVVARAGVSMVTSPSMSLAMLPTPT